jgi:ABC-type sugar transport system ATPase subunit
MAGEDMAGENGSGDQRDASRAEEAPVLLSLQGVRKAYPGVVAVDDVTLSIPAGEIVGLVGKNGAGKSTMIKIIGGVVRPDAGRVLVDGVHVDLHGPRDALHSGIALVPQELSLAPGLNVAENVFLGLGYPKHAGTVVSRSQLTRRTRELLRRLEVHIEPTDLIDSLSIAHQRVVMIARALAQNARLVILDEPSASLTAEEITHLHDVVRLLRTHDVAVIYVSHRLDEIFALCDRIVTMRDGGVVFDQLKSETTPAELVVAITGTAKSVRASEHFTTSPSDHIALEVANLSVPGKLDNVSFMLMEGEILGIAGMVGAGRTELARAVFGATHATADAVKVNGQRVRIRSPRQALAHGIVLLPEDRKGEGLLLDESIRRNITLPNLPRHRVRRWLPITSARRERKSAQEVIKSLGVAANSDIRPVSTLSGGNQQKIVLGKWLLSDNRILFFDEPTHGVDVAAKSEVYQLMRDLAAEGKSIVFISSEFGELIEVCHRILVLREGRIVDEYSGSAVTEADLTRACYVTSG